MEFVAYLYVDTLQYRFMLFVFTKYRHIRLYILSNELLEKFATKRHEGNRQARASCKANRCRHPDTIAYEMNAISLGCSGLT